MIRQRTLDALRGLRWPSATRVPPGMPGMHRATVTGGGSEFVAYRSYRQGDDPRRIDWKLLARSDRAYVRVHEERAWLPTWFVVDASASLAFAGLTGGVAAPSAWDVLRALVPALASVALAGGDPVGVLVVRGDASPLVRTPRSRRTVLDEIGTLLDGVTPAGDAAIAPALARIPRGARVVLLGDWLGDTDAVVRAAARAVVAGSSVYAVQVLHPDAADPPRGAWTARDPRHAHDERPLHEATRALLTTSVAAWRRDLARRWQRAHVPFVSASSRTEPARIARDVVRAR